MTLTSADLCIEKWRAKVMKTRKKTIKLLAKYLPIKSQNYVSRKGAKKTQRRKDKSRSLRLCVFFASLRETNSSIFESDLNRNGDHMATVPYYFLTKNAGLVSRIVWRQFRIIFHFIAWKRQ